MNTAKISRASLLAVLALAAGAPAADAAKPSSIDDAATVCNQATPHSLGGALETLPGDPTPPARYTKGLNAHPGQGKGLVNAAGNSPALQVCGEGQTDGGDGSGGGDDGSGGGGDDGGIIIS